jgi:type IV secretion system protein VirB4
LRVRLCGKSIRSRVYRDAGEKNQKYFSDKLDELETALTASRQIRLKRMGVEAANIEGLGSEVIMNSELLQALNYVINGRWHPVRIPTPAPTYLDTILARDMLVGDPLIYDDSHVMVISVMGYPQVSYPGILHSLSLLPFELRVSNRFIFTDFLDASGNLTSLRKRWAQKTKSFLAVCRFFGTRNQLQPHPYIVSPHMIEVISSFLRTLYQLEALFVHYLVEPLDIP